MKTYPQLKNVAKQENKRIQIAVREINKRWTCQQKKKWVKDTNREITKEMQMVINKVPLHQ